jgi:hypothetical protein
VRDKFSLVIRSQVLRQALPKAPETRAAMHAAMEEIRILNGRGRSAAALRSQLERRDRFDSRLD